MTEEKACGGDSAATEGEEEKACGGDSAATEGEEEEACGGDSAATEGEEEKACGGDSASAEREEEEACGGDSAALSELGAASEWRTVSVEPQVLAQFAKSADDVQLPATTPRGIVASNDSFRATDSLVKVIVNYLASVHIGGLLLVALQNQAPAALRTKLLENLSGVGHLEASFGAAESLNVAVVVVMLKKDYKEVIDRGGFPTELIMRGLVSASTGNAPPLFAASVTGYFEVSDIEGCTTLHCAVTGPSSRAVHDVRALLEYRDMLDLDLEARLETNNGQWERYPNCTPFLLAVDQRREAVMALLAEAGADVNASGGMNGFNALTHALFTDWAEQTWVSPSTALLVLALPDFTAIDDRSNILQLPALQVWALETGQFDDPDWVAVLAALLRHPLWDSKGNVDMRFSDGNFGARGSALLCDSDNSNSDYKVVTALHLVAHSYSTLSGKARRMAFDAYNLLVAAGADEGSTVCSDDCPEKDRTPLLNELHGATAREVRVLIALVFRVLARALSS